MNRYPIWKYAIIVITLLLAAVYTIPNFYGESLAVQISAKRATVTVDNALRDRVVAVVKQIGLPPENALDDMIDGNFLQLRYSKADQQFKAMEAVQKVLGEDDYNVAPNLLPKTPHWLRQLGAKPMARGLDLRGGVHFLLEVDMKAAVDKALETTASTARRALHDADIRSRVERNGDLVEVRLRNAESVDAAAVKLKQQVATADVTSVKDGSTFKVVLSYKPEAMQQLKLDAVQRNITILHNRVNELGVAEPVIQQQGEGRIVVQLPGIQDTGKAKEILGRTATLELRLVDDDPQRVSEAIAGVVPAGFELAHYVDGKRAEDILLKKDVELTGDSIIDAKQEVDRDQRPIVALWLNSDGESIIREVSRANIKKRLAVVLVEHGKLQVITAPVIQSELGSNFQITGPDRQECQDISLLIRAGSLAAPMSIVEERTIGPTQGEENITKGFNSTLYGFAAIALFMLVYYRMFGVVSISGLACNLMFLTALLSAMQATLTLPGIAAIALTLGMAIDSNVLINERVREELRNGMGPQSAISAGYQHAWATILDSNVTSLIVGVALLSGTGAVRGFAVVHCLGILTSMYSAVFVSRGVVNLIYGYRRKLTSLSV